MAREDRAARAAARHGRSPAAPSWSIRARTRAGFSGALPASRLSAAAVRSDVRDLQPYTVQVRYPGYEATLTECLQAVAILRRARTALRSTLALP